MKTVNKKMAVAAAMVTVVVVGGNGDVSDDNGDGGSDGGGSDGGSDGGSEEYMLFSGDAVSGRASAKLAAAVVQTEMRRVKRPGRTNDKVRDDRRARHIGPPWYDARSRHAHKSTKRTGQCEQVTLGGRAAADDHDIIGESEVNLARNGTPASYGFPRLLPCSGIAPRRAASRRQA